MRYFTSQEDTFVHYRASCPLWNADKSLRLARVMCFLVRSSMQTERVTRFAGMAASAPTQELPRLMWVNTRTLLEYLLRESPFFPLTQLFDDTLLPHHDSHGPDRFCCCVHCSGHVILAAAAATVATGPVRYVLPVRQHPVVQGSH